MSIKQRLKKLERTANVNQQDKITFHVILAPGFPFKDDREQCARYRKQIAEREELGEMAGIMSLNCQICEERCEHAK